LLFDLVTSTSQLTGWEDWVFASVRWSAGKICVQNDPVCAERDVKSYPIYLPIYLPGEETAQQISMMLGRQHHPTW